MSFLLASCMSCLRYPALSFTSLVIDRQHDQVTLLPMDVLFLASLLAKELRELVSAAVSTSVLTSSVATQQSMK